MKRHQILLHMLCTLLFLNSSAQTPVRMGFEGFDSSYACNEFINQNLSVYIPHYNNFYNSYAQRKKLKAIIEIDRVKKKGEDKVYNQNDKSWSKNIWLYKNGWLTDEISIHRQITLSKMGVVKYQTDTTEHIHYGYNNINNNLKIEKTILKYQNDPEFAGSKLCYYFSQQKTIDSIIFKEGKTIYVYDDSNRISEKIFCEKEQPKSKQTFTYEYEHIDSIADFEELKHRYNSYPEMIFLRTEIKSKPINCIKISVTETQLLDPSKTKTKFIHNVICDDFTFFFFKKNDLHNHKQEIISMFLKSKNGVISNFTELARSIKFNKLENCQLKGDYFEKLDVFYFYPVMNIITDNRTKFAKDLRKRIYFGTSKRNGFYYKLIR